MHQAVEPPGEVRTDYETLCALAERLGVLEAFSEGRDADEWVRHFYDTTRANLAEKGVELPAFEEFWEAGRVELPTPPLRRALDFAALRADPAAAPLPTPSGRIELASATIAGFGYDDCPGHPAWMEPAEWLGSDLARRFPLHLISNQPRDATALPVRQRQLQPGLQGQRPRADPAASRRRPRARDLRRRRRARVQRPRRLSRGSGARRQPAALGRAALDGCLVGSRLAGRSERAGSPRQPQRADAGQGHLAPGAGADRTDGAGRARALRRPAAGGRGVHAARVARAPCREGRARVRQRRPDGRPARGAHDRRRAALPSGGSGRAGGGARGAAPARRRPAAARGRARAADGRDQHLRRHAAPAAPDRGAGHPRGARRARAASKTSSCSSPPARTAATPTPSCARCSATRCSRPCASSITMPATTRR